MTPVHLVPLLLAAVGVRAIGPRAPKPPEVTLAKNFTWTDPWSANASFLLEPFEAACTAEKTFSAGKLYLLHDLYVPYPLGLKPWSTALKSFFKGREYPGGFDGWDRHLHDRELALMPYLELPKRVREWIREQESTEDAPGKGLFAIYDLPDDALEADKRNQTKVAGPAAEIPKELELHRRRIEEHRVAIFAPGAMYGILPLWVAEGSECEDTLADLSKYTSVPRDGGVVAWPISYERPPRMQDKRELTFTIRAQVLRTKGSAGVWDEKEKEKEDEGASEKVVKVEAAEQTEKSSDANSASKTKTSSEDSATTKPEVEKDEL